MSLLAIFPPLLAAATLWYMTKAIGMGNIFSPAGALSMATAGAGKIVNDRAVNRAAGRVLGGAKRAPENAAKWAKGSSRSAIASRAALRAGNKGLQKARHLDATKAVLGTASAIADPKAALEKGKTSLGAKMESLAAAGSRLKDDVKSNPVGVARRGLATANEAGLARGAQLLEVAASVGMWAAGQNGELGRSVSGALAPLTKVGDKNAHAAMARARTREENAQLKGLTGEERESVRAAIFSNRADDAARALRGLPPGVPVGDPLDEREVSSRAQLTARAMGKGVKADDIMVDPYTSNAFAGLQATKIPDMGSPEATWEAAKQAPPYFGEFAKLKPGESQTEWATRMTNMMIIKELMDPDTGATVDMLDYQGLKDTAETRQKVMDSADIRKKAPLDFVVEITAADIAKCEAMAAARPVLAASAGKSRVEEAMQVLTTEVKQNRIEHQSTVEEVRRSLGSIAANPAAVDFSQLAAVVENSFVSALAGHEIVIAEAAGVRAQGQGDASSYDAVRRQLEQLTAQQDGILGAAMGLLNKAQTAPLGPAQTQATEELLAFMQNALESNNSDLTRAMTEAQETLAKEQEDAMVRALRGGMNDVVRGMSLLGSNKTSAPPALNMAS